MQILLTHVNAVNVVLGESNCTQLSIAVDNSSRDSVSAEEPAHWSRLVSGARSGMQDSDNGGIFRQESRESHCVSIVFLAHRMKN
ncbi:hypothetical protein [Streptosporangium sp. NPDC052375]|uniref:hypothetical protein n=1 Tax=Streptosporangium sp. NPDC052375 TaxID=3366195 RepID=UPI0037CD74E7